jgi:hypothetical protein
MGRDHIERLGRKLSRAAHDPEILRLVDGDAARFAALLLHGVSRLVNVASAKCAAGRQDARLDRVPVIEPRQTAAQVMSVVVVRKISHVLRLLNKNQTFI